jgi:hypothetical protein
MRKLPLLLLATACVSSGSDLGFGPDETRVVAVDVYLDRDGSRTPTPVVDTVYRGARVALFIRNSADTFKTATTNQIGRALFTGVPTGQYRIAIVPSSIGDSIEVQAIQITIANIPVDTNEVKVTFPEDTTVAFARLGYPEYSVREVRNLPLGRRVFIRGVILAGVQSFRETTSHVTDSSLAIRLTRVSLKGGLTGNNPGDSVSRDRHYLDARRSANARQREYLEAPALAAAARSTSRQHRHRRDGRQWRARCGPGAADGRGHQ